jgi:hypothetical protein
MATRHFENVQLATLPNSGFPNSEWSSRLMRGYAAPLRKFPRVAQQEEENEHPGMDWPPPSAVIDFRKFARCMRWAFALEGGAALLGCAVWMVCRLL